VSKIFRLPYQPRCRFDQSFQQKHAGQYRERRKVVGEIFLRQRNVLDRCDLLAGFQRNNFVNQYKSHKSAFSRQYLAGGFIAGFHQLQYKFRNKIHKKQLFFQRFFAFSALSA
jgi:hypothetical protein